MTKLFVLPLDHWMLSNDDFDFHHDGYHKISPGSEYEKYKLNRNGQYYRRDIKFWWFEINGEMYTKFEDNGRQIEYFLYHLRTYDREILTSKEVEAFKIIIGKTTDSAVKKVLQKKLYEHDDAFQLRRSSREAGKFGLRLRRRMSTYKKQKLTNPGLRAKIRHNKP